MKIVVPFILLAACGNPKADIVNQQQNLRKQIDSLDKLDERISSDFNMKRAEYALKYLKQMSFTDMMSDSLYLEGIMVEAKIKGLQKQYDSLSLELKKY